MTPHSTASLELLRRFAPGTPLRTAAELIMAQGTGGLIVGVLLAYDYIPGLEVAQEKSIAEAALRMQVAISSSLIVTSLAGAFVGGWLVARRDADKAQGNQARP